MLKKILIIVFGAVFIAGCAFMYAGRPDVDIGEVEVENNETTITPKDYHISTRYKDDVKEHQTLEILDISDDIPEVTQKVKRDTPVGEEIVSDIKVSYKGKYAGDIYYTVFNEDGEEIVSKSKVLNIPTGEIDSCIVKISVFWGKEKNYEEYEYYFKVKYKYV